MKITKIKRKTPNISCSTWQSIYKMPRAWFEKFECVIVDEVHGAKAKSLTTILEKMSNTELKFGTTGTLDGTETNQMVIEGLFGTIFQVTTTDKLIKQDVLTNFNVECLLLKWSDSACKAAANMSYQEEINWIVTNDKRNEIIVNMATKLPGNNLVLTQWVDKHADVLIEMIKKKTNRPVYYIHGGVDAEIRNEYRAQIENETDAIIIATTKAFATGTNIKKLDNIFFTHPGKSRITTLQAIGRVLRKSKEKKKATLYDIVDDLVYEKHKNFSMRHFFERLKIYQTEKFPYKIKKVGYK